MPVVPLVLCAAALHATWNALVKPASDRVAMMGGISLVMAAVCVPAALVVTPPRSAAWPELAASSLLQVAYNLVLAASYRDSDFSQVYPIARGTAPPTVAIAAAIVVGEGLGVVRIAGLVALSAGLLVLARAPRAGHRRAIRLALLTGLLIAAYTVVDGVGVRRSGTPLGYAVWLFAASGLLTALAVATRRGRVAPTRTSAVVAALTMLAYGLVLWAQTRGALAVVAGLRETSVIFAALIGAVAFGEPMGRRRILASVTVAGGAIMLALG